MKNDILSFAKKYLSFKPTKFQEAFLSQTQGRKTLCWWNRNPYKRTLTNEFTYEGLTKLKVGEKFGIATLKGFAVFKRIKIIKPKIKVYYDEVEEMEKNNNRHLLQ